MIDRIKLLAGLMGLLYVISSLTSILFFLLDISYFVIDPIESLILILIGIIFIKGYYYFEKSNNSVGKAYVFVGFITGSLLGSIALLNLLVNGVMVGLIEQESINDLIKKILYFTTPTLIMGIISFYFHTKIAKYENILYIR